MDDERRNLEMRREIVDAYIAVTDDSDTLMRICATATGGEEDVVAAVSAAFGVGEIPARAILDCQVRRFTPRQRARLREERETIQRRLDRDRHGGESEALDAP